jgi:hypothetical protein
MEYVSFGIKKASVVDDILYCIEEAGQSHINIYKNCSHVNVNFRVFSSRIHALSIKRENGLREKFYPKQL